MTAPLPVLLAVAAAVVASYALACWQAPFGVCRHCHLGRPGRPGRHLGRLGRRADPLCRWCDGTGRRVRLGRRTWTYLGRLHDRH
jgi:hypothetical protein